MIASNSRYASANIVTLDANGTSRQVIQPNAPVVTTFSYVSHVYTGAETLDGLAYTYFGDPTKWWHIADVNPEILDWKDITPGTTIRIPTL